MIPVYWVNYVFGMDDTKPQQLLPPFACLGAWIAALTGIVFFVTTHFPLKIICPSAGNFS